MSSFLRSFQTFDARFSLLHVLLCLWLFSFLLHEATAAPMPVPMWQSSAALIAHANKNLGCVHDCSFGHPKSQHNNFTNSIPSSSSKYLLTTGDGEPIRFPELSAGHFLVIPVAAVAALGYHLLKVKAGRPLSS